MKEFEEATRAEGDNSGPGYAIRGLWEHSYTRDVKPAPPPTANHAALGKSLYLCISVSLPGK